MFYLSGNTANCVWNCNWYTLSHLLWEGTGKRYGAVSNPGMYADHHRSSDLYDWIVGGCTGCKQKDITGDTVSYQTVGV